MVLMMDIKIISAFSIVFVSLMVSNEFLEFLVNIIYTAILFIVILFFYQNRQHLFNIQENEQKQQEVIGNVKKVITKEILIENSNTEPTIVITKEQTPGTVKYIQNYSPIISTTHNGNNNEIKQLTNKNQELQTQINKQIEKQKEEQLKYFNDCNKFQIEINLQIEKIKQLAEKNDDLINSILILNSTIDGNRNKIQEISKDRDSIYSSEQKLLIKLTNFEKREKEQQELEKQLKLKLSDSKDQYSNLKKEFDEKIKRQTKLENQIVSLENQISKLLHKQDQKEKEKLRDRDSSDSNSSIFSSSPSKSIPIPIANNNKTNSNDNLGGSNSSISPPNSSSSSFLKDSSDGDSDSSQSSSSETKFKSLFNKVKTEFYSSKIVNKAQKGINKHLGSDFFTPTTTATSATATASAISSTPTTANTSTTDVVEQQLEIIQDKTESSPSSTVKPLVFFDDLNVVGSDDLRSSREEDQIHSKISTSPSGEVLQKEQSLSDLFIRNSGSSGGSSNISLSALDDLIINDNNNNNNNGNNSNNSSNSNNNVNEEQSILAGEDDELIREFSIKDEENKIGLRRAKKKLSPGSSTMMEDVSIGLYPFLEKGSNEIGLFGVFDGHAGRGAADSAAKLFPEEFKKLILENNLNNDDESKLITQAFKRVDDRMKEHEYEGCTATVSLIWKTQDSQRYIQVGNVGDSSAFLCRNNQAIELTFDHKANDPSEKQRIKDSGIPISENQTRINGVAVSRSLGNHFIKEQNIGMISVPHVSNCYLLNQSQDKFLVIASDGLWDIINGQSAIDRLLPLFENGASSDLMASTLLETAVQSSMCKDNVTVIVVKL